jgi:acyl carrier protein
MKPTTSLNGTSHTDLIAVVGESIRSVSAKARALQVNPDTLLLEELGLDSLDMVAVILRIQDHFQVEIDPDEIPNLRSVDDLVVSLANHLRAAA